MAIDQKLIDRLNDLARKNKNGTITPLEIKERAKLRKEYLTIFRKGFKQRLENLDITWVDKDKDGNVISKKKIHPRI